MMLPNGEAFVRARAAPKLSSNVEEPKSLPCIKLNERVVNFVNYQSELCARLVKLKHSSVNSGMLIGSVRTH
jgi:hypothetical protein